jgi:hypothetical protein
MELKDILEIMQEVDPNGEWMQGLEDIENGEETLEGLIECMNITLNNWKDEVEENSFEYWTFQSWICDLYFIEYDMKNKGDVNNE